MNKVEAMRIILDSIGNQVVISANGFISRDLHQVKDKPSNFYMIGSMGLASSIGLGIALKNSRKKINVFDGDGNILMNLGSLTTIGTLKPKNLVHFIFDNGLHESTGSQPTTTKEISIDKIAHETDYKIFRINTRTRLESVLKKIKNMPGPIMILIKINKSNEKGNRIKHTPIEIKNRFMNELN